MNLQVSAANSPTLFKTDGHRWGLSHWGLGVILRSIFRFSIEVEGLENVPEGESMIVAGAPHRNWLDPFLVILAMPRRPRIYYLAKRDAVFNTWWKSAIVGAFGGVIPVDASSEMNRDALEAALGVLRSEASLGIFPEGWNHMHDPPDRLARIQRGVGWLAVKTGRRVLPVGLAGTRDLWRGKTLRVRFGEPVAPPAEGTNRAREEAVQQAVEQALHALLPPQPPNLAPEERTWPWLSTLMG